MPANSELWQSWEDDFLKEVYPLREWSIYQIAEKLERSKRSLTLRASKLGLRRPRRLNYDAISRLSSEGMGINGIARRLNYSRPG